MPLYIILLQKAFLLVLFTLAPIIAILLAAGLITSFIQASFQIEDATLGQLPKNVLMIIIALFGGFGALPVFSHYAVDCIMHASSLARQPWW